MCDAYVPIVMIELIPQTVDVHLPLGWARSRRTCFARIDLDTIVTLLRGPGETHMKESGIGDPFLGRMGGRTHERIVPPHGSPWLDALRPER